MRNALLDGLLRRHRGAGSSPLSRHFVFGPSCGRNRARTGSFRSGGPPSVEGNVQAFRAVSLLGLRHSISSAFRSVRTRAGPWRRRALRRVCVPASGSRNRRPLSKDPAREAAGHRSPCRARAGFLAGRRLRPGTTISSMSPGPAVSPVTGSCTPKRASRRSFRSVNRFRINPSPCMTGR